MSRIQFLVYGRELFEDIAASRIEREVAGAIIEVDQETDELERLLALIQVIKGKHDYRSSQ